MGASDKGNGSNNTPVMGFVQSTASSLSKSRMTADELETFLAIVRENDLKLRKLAEGRVQRENNKECDT